ncbi:hypothetical protein RB195_006304 [Necator americanus]
MRDVYYILANNHKRLCHRHFADAAKFLAGEMAAMGIPFSHFEDPSAIGCTAYVSETDVPLHLVDCLNAAVKLFEKDVLITVRDVTVYLNGSLRRYYSESGWNTVANPPPKWKTKGRRLGKRTKKHEDNQISDELVFNDADAEDVKDFDMLDHTGSVPENETESTGLDYGIPLSELANTSAIKKEPIFDSAEDQESSSAAILHRGPKLESTNPAFLKQSFVVDGETLLKLFRFCPQCGMQLSNDGSVQLDAVGAIPIVQYVCIRCYENAPSIKVWRGQK